MRRMSWRSWSESLPLSVFSGQVGSEAAVEAFEESHDGGGLLARQELPELGPALRAALGPGVDDFVAEDPQALGTGLQPAGDPPGCPVLMEPLDHEGRQLRQAVAQQAASPPRQLASLGRLRPGGVIGVAVVGDFPANRRRRPAQASGNRAPRSPGFMKPGDRKPFLHGKMLAG